MTAPKRKKIFGRFACQAVFERRPHDILRVAVAAAEKSRWSKLLKYCAQNKIPYSICSDAELETIAKTLHHEGISIVAQELPATKLSDLNGSPLIVLAGVANPHNIGAIVRSAANFSCAGVVLCNIDQVSGGSLYRTAEGGAEYVPLVIEDSVTVVLQSLSKRGYQIAAADQLADASLFGATFPDKVAFVLGAESTGLRDIPAKLFTKCYSVPGSGVVESLNVSVTAALFLAEYWRCRATQMPPG